MPHKRQDIRDAVKVLLTGLATSGARLYPARRIPWTDANLPGVAFYLDSEQSDRPDKDEGLIRRPMLVIDLAAKNADGEALENTLDSMAAEVETALASDRTLGGRLSMPMELVRTAPPPPETDVGSATAVKRLEYQLQYETP